MSTTAAAVNGAVGVIAQRWYYVEAGQKVGPCTFDTLLLLLRAGRLGLTTRVWTAGMVTWTPAADVAVLMEAVPPAAPAPAIVSRAPAATAAAVPAPNAPASTTGDAWTATAAAPSSSDEPEEARATDLPKAHPWLRYWARSVDYSVAALLSVLMLAALGNAAAFASALLLLVMVAWFPVEAVLLTTLGTTPGKALFAMSVRSTDGRLLDFTAALRRSFGVWLMGLGLGIPLVSLITMLVAHDRLVNTRTTRWDEKAGSVVVHGALGPGRVLLMILAVVGFVGLCIAGLAS